MRILLVEDNLSLAEGLVTLLRQSGYAVDVVHDGASAEALASQQPFCVDTLDFEAWLQWLFLPRMKQLLEMAGPLPAASGIRPMAEERYRGRESEVQALLVALGEFDRLIGSAR